jgi:hypothetical protein
MSDVQSVTFATSSAPCISLECLGLCERFSRMFGGRAADLYFYLDRALGDSQKALSVAKIRYTAMPATPTASPTAYRDKCSVKCSVILRCGTAFWGLIDHLHFRSRKLGLEGVVSKRLTAHSALQVRARCRPG